MRARHAALTARRAELQQHLDETSSRVAELELGRHVELTPAMARRKLGNVLLRFALSAVAFSGFMLGITTDWDFGVASCIALIEAGAVWWLGELADRLEMRDG